MCRFQCVDGLGASPGYSYSTFLRRSRISTHALNKEVIELAKDVVGFCRQTPAHDKAVLELDKALRKIHKLVKATKDNLDAINVATLIHQLAAIAASTKRQRHILGQHFDLVSTLLELAVDKVSEFEPNHISQIVWACGKLGDGLLIIPIKNVDAAMLVGRLITKAAQDVNKFTPLNISQMLLGLANLRYQGAQEFVKIMARMASIQRQGFSHQGLSNLLWSLAKLDYKDDAGVITWLCMEIKDRINEFEPQAISNIMLALAKMSCRSYPNIFSSITDAAIASLHGSTPKRWPTCCGLLSN